jgi:hypothetical protein
MRADSAVEPTKSENITVTWRRSARSSGEALGALGVVAASAEGALFPASLRRAAIASRSLRRCPTMPTPKSFRSSAPPPPVPLGIFHALCRFSTPSRPSNHPLPDRPPSSRYDAISRLGLWRWTVPDLASLEYHSPLSEVGNSANRQAEDRQGWPAKTRLGAAQVGREPLGRYALVISRL